MTLSASAVLVEFSISTWSGRRQAKGEAADITRNAKAVSEAASVSKHLMAGTTELAAIQSAASEIRKYVQHYTLPWSDAGTRLLPMTKYVEFCDGLDKLVKKFNQAADDLVSAYPTIVTAQAFKLGSLFNRADYPSTSSLRHRFKVHVRFQPVPEAGHFLMEQATTELGELQRRLAEDKQASLDAMMKDTWARLYEALKKLNTIATPTENGKLRRVRSATIEGLSEVTSLLTDFNVANDPTLEQARQELEKVLAGITVDALRDEKSGVHDVVRSQTQSIMDKFDFGLNDEDGCDANE